MGQVFEAAIPIAIIAVGLSNALKKKNALGQNVIIQSIGSCSGVIVAGAIFTLPALFILQGTYPDIVVDFTRSSLSSLLGGILGILFFIPFRKYFVKRTCTAKYLPLPGGDSHDAGCSYRASRRPLPEKVGTGQDPL